MEKEYYTLTELTERWDFCLHDALYLAENNICRFWINLPESDAIRFRKESNNGLTYDLPLENCQAKGLLLLTTGFSREKGSYRACSCSSQRALFCFIQKW